MTTGRTDTISFGRIIAETVGVYGRRFLSLSGFSLVASLPLAIVYLLLAEGIVDPTDAMEVVVPGISAISRLVIVAMAVRIAWDATAGRRPPTGETLRLVVPTLPVVIAVGILSLFATAVGFIVLVLPGIWVAVYTWLVVPTSVIERLGIMKSFARSRDLVSKAPWIVFFIAVLLFFLERAPGFAGEKWFHKGHISLTAYYLFDIVVMTLLTSLKGVAIAVTYRALRDFVRQDEIDAIADVFNGPAATSEAPAADALIVAESP